MSRNQLGVPRGERLQHSQTGCGADYRAARPNRERIQRCYGSESSEAWMNSKGQSALARIFAGGFIRPPPRESRQETWPHSLAHEGDPAPS